MHKLQVTNVDDWVYMLRTVPIYAILSGLPRRYAFAREKGKKNEKLNPKNPKITEKLVARVLRAGSQYYSSMEHDLLAFGQAVI